jgi:hypothetical protein
MPAIRRISIFVFVIMIAASGCMYAQIAMDVNDRLYDLLELWYEHGYISKLPILQPYPIKAIVGMLKEVKDKAPLGDSAIADDYIGFLGKGDSPAYSMFHARTEAEYIVNGWDVYGNNYGEGFANGSLGDLVDFSGRLNIGLKVLPNTDFFPRYTVVIDEGESGGADINISGRRLEVRNFYQGAFFVGVEDLYLMAGITRSAFGPIFEDSTVIGPQCYASGQLAFEWDAGWFVYTSALHDLMPKYKRDPYSSVLETISTPLNKFLILQNFAFYPSDFVNFGIVQTMVAGELKLTYLIPAQNLIYSQVYYGEYDNSLMGAYVQVRLPGSVELDSVFYFDDLSFNRFAGIDGGIPFNLDSAQNKFAFQAGATWAPCMDFLRKIGLTYTMVTPYMYTHINRGYDLTYTNQGTNLGSVLEPNSDELALEYVLSPFRVLDAELRLRYVRHGNASEGTTNINGDGSIYDDGYAPGENPTFLGASRFLTQGVLEHTLQASIDLHAAFRLFDAITLDAGIGYLFEYVWNHELASGIDRIENLVSLSLGFTY